MKQKFVFQWHITHKCNLRCKHCYQEEYCTDLQEQELVQTFFKILDFVKEKEYIGHINFTGGEPLVSDCLWKLFDLCTEHNITFGILTNGTLIDESVAEQLTGYKGLRFVQVSIDGIKSTHDAIRGEGNFDRAMNALRLLRQAGIQTMVSFTCTKKNYKELKHVIRLCERAKVDRFWTDRLIPTGNNQLELVSTKEYIRYMKVLGRESKRAKRNPFIRTKVHTNRALQFMCGCEERCYNCSAGKTLLTILADGTLLPCRRLPIEIGRIQTDATISELIEHSEIIQQLKTAKLPIECRQCKYRCCCKGGAKCLTYAVTGNIDKKDINCPMRKKKEEKQLC